MTRKTKLSEQENPFAFLKDSGVTRSNQQPSKTTFSSAHYFSLKVHKYFEEGASVQEQSQDEGWATARFWYLLSFFQVHYPGINCYPMSIVLLLNLAKNGNRENELPSLIFRIPPGKKPVNLEVRKFNIFKVKIFPKYVPESYLQI